MVVFANVAKAFDSIPHRTLNSELLQTAHLSGSPTTLFIVYKLQNLIIHFLLYGGKFFGKFPRELIFDYFFYALVSVAFVRCLSSASAYLFSDDCRISHTH